MGAFDLKRAMLDREAIVKHGSSGLQQRIGGFDQRRDKVRCKGSLGRA